MKKSFLKQSMGSRIFDIINTLGMLLFAFVMIYPFWNQLIVSFNEGSDTIRGGLYFWPRKFTLANYLYAFRRSNLLSGTMMSVLRVAVGTSTSLICSALIAYVITIKDFKGSKLLSYGFLVTMYFSGGMIPVYLLYSSIGLTESFTVYWLPGLVNAFNMLLISSYIRGLPEALPESARLDGASELKVYFRIILPICKPVLAAVGIMVAVGHWNSWFDVMIYNSSGRYDTLQLTLRKILLEADKVAKLIDDQKRLQELKNMTPTSMRAAVTMIVTIPMLVIYPFFQKYFVSGITIGAVKA
ncbi:putative aldouronate transport system permease protein [Anaerotaenia torta]|uniref:carbohydrate ABC transporter permease n=1 Tax=Anaerotaenia torta TaxID=433293 RepID=UPI003D1E25FE